MDTVTLIHDQSWESQQVKTGLEERGINYVAIGSDQCETDLFPKIEVGAVVYRTLSVIDFFFFGSLDRGETIGGVSTGPSK